MHRALQSMVLQSLELWAFLHRDKAAYNRRTVAMEKLLFLVNFSNFLNSVCYLISIDQLDCKSQKLDCQKPKRSKYALMQLCQKLDCQKVDCKSQKIEICINWLDLQTNTYTIDKHFLTKYFQLKS